jgi:hypothetical protein
MTSKNVVNATIVLEFDNGEYAITGTKNKAVIDVCCSLLEFKRMPKKYFENYSLAELDIEGGVE